MNRAEKIKALRARSEDVRRLALDEIDANARATNTFGSQAHRAARGRVETEHEAALASYGGRSDEDLDVALRDFDESHPV